MARAWQASWGADLSCIPSTAWSGHPGPWGRPPCRGRDRGGLAQSRSKCGVPSVVSAASRSSQNCSRGGSHRTSDQLRFAGAGVCELLDITVGTPLAVATFPVVPMSVPLLAYGRQHNSKGSILQQSHLPSPQPEKPRSRAGALVPRGLSETRVSLNYTADTYCTRGQCSELSLYDPPKGYEEPLLSSHLQVGGLGGQEIDSRSHSGHMAESGLEPRAADSSVGGHGLP